MVTIVTLLKFSIAVIQFVPCITTSCFLDKLWLSYGFENVGYDKLDNFVFKYVHEFKYNLNVDEIYAVVDVFLILNFFTKLLSNFGEFKFIITSTTAHITSALKVCSNSCTYLETKASDPSYDAFSIPLKGQTHLKAQNYYVWIRLFEFSIAIT